MTARAALRVLTATETVAGVDEAGRGPLAGPVVAAAVILDARRPIAGLRDSKQLAPARREALAAAIRERALAWALGWSDACEVDALDILQATHLAMRRALQGLAIRPGRVQVDGNRCPSVAGLGFDCRMQAVVGGDRRIPAISAASILAKTARDAWMTQRAQAYPQYDFARHKGYPTPQHLRLLARHGPCRLHRLSFAPVRSSHAPG